MRRLAAIALLLLVPLAASAQERKYAVLSLVGDKLLIVTRELATGSNLDKNDRTFVELPDNSIDRAVTLAVDDQLRQANPGSQPILLHSRRADLYDASYKSMDRQDGVGRVYQAVKPIVEKTSATHLVLVTKARGRARVQLRDGMVGNGFLEGVGFYVDYGSLARGIDPNEAEAGFIAPFSYMMVSVIDLKTGQIVSQHQAIRSRAATPSTAGLRERNVGHAWHRLDEKEKVARLTEVIREETAKVMPVVLAQR